jgi:hypothetical protein
LKRIFKAKNYKISLIHTSCIKPAKISIFHSITDLNGVAADFAILNVFLFGYTGVEQHGDFGEAKWALKKMFDFHGSGRLDRYNM